MNLSFFQRWDNWWCRSCPPHLLAIFRIGFGLFLIIEALTYLPFVPDLFSNEGLVISMHLPSLPDALEPLFQPPSVWAAWIVALVYMLALCALTLGIGMRMAIVILIVLFWYYWQLSFHLFPSSYHRIFILTLFVLLFSGADKTFSLRMLRTHGSIFAWEPINIMAQRIISVQIAATYLGVGWQKLWLPTWQGGEVLSYSFITRWGHPWAFAIVRLNWPIWVYDVWVWSVKIFECLIPFALWNRMFRWWFMAGGAMFHIGIAILIEIWWFIVLIPAYIVFFSPEEVHAYLQKKSKGRIR